MLFPELNLIVLRQLPFQESIQWHGGGKPWCSTFTVNTYIQCIACVGV